MQNQQFKLSAFLLDRNDVLSIIRFKTEEFHWVALHRVVNDSVWLAFIGHINGVTVSQRFLLEMRRRSGCVSRDSHNVTAFALRQSSHLQALSNSVFQPVSTKGCS